MFKVRSSMAILTASTANCILEKTPFAMASAPAASAAPFMFFINPFKVVFVFFRVLLVSLDSLSILSKLFFDSVPTSSIESTNPSTWLFNFCILFSIPEVSPSILIVSTTAIIYFL